MAQNKTKQMYLYILDTLCHMEYIDWYSQMFQQGTC